MHLSARRSFWSLATAVALICPVGSARASTESEVRAFFDRFVQVQNAHHARALETLLADSPQFLWITRGTAVWGREAALQRWAKLYEGTWRLDPDPASVRVTPLVDGAAQLHATVQFTVGKALQRSRARRPDDTSCSCPGRRIDVPRSAARKDLHDRLRGCNPDPHITPFSCAREWHRVC